MTMMTCPKCGFEQPTDQFCAKCGVNVASFKPAVALGTGLKSVFKPLAFIAIIVGVIFFLYKNVVLTTIETPELEIEESTQIGSGAGSLKVVGAQTNAAVTKSKISADALSGRKAQPVTETKTAALTEATPVKFNQVQVSFIVGEEMLEQIETDGKPDQNWHLVSQVNPIFSSSPEEVTLKSGNNTFEYADELITYDMNFFVEEITEKDVKIKLNIKRTMRAQAQDGLPTNSFSLSERIPLGQTLVVVDSLPRRASIDRPNSILSTLYKSQMFLSRASELVQIIKFENPSNSPQE